MKIILNRNAVDRDMVDVMTVIPKQGMCMERRSLWAVVHSDMFCENIVLANLLEHGNEVTMLLRFTEDSE